MRKAAKFVIVPPNEAPDLTHQSRRQPTEEALALESGAILFVPEASRSIRSIRSIGNPKSYLGRRKYRLCVRSGQHKGAKGHYVRAERVD